MSLLQQTKKQKQAQKQKPRLKNSAKLPKLSIQEQIDNNEVIQRMNRKITFAKNPRHLGSTITYQDAINNKEFHIQATSNIKEVTHNNHNTKNSHGLTRNQTQNMLNMSINNNERPKFRSIPQSIMFNHFEPHHTYQAEIKLVNTSNVIQRIKITPFSLKEFNIYKVQYPKQDSGDIAPGISVNIFIRFRPLNLNDLEEELIVIYNGGTIRIKIQARRQRPKIQWPKQIDLGHCWVGNKMIKELIIYNEGGQDEYNLIRKESNGQKNPKECKIGSFLVQPCTLIFAKQSSQVLKINFIPQQAGHFSQKIIFQSNQGQHQTIQIKLKGGSYNAQIILQSLNGQQVKQQSIQNNLYLNGTQVDKLSTAKLKLKNLAVVDVDYFWYFEDQYFRNRMNKQGNRIINISNNKGKLNASTAFQFQVSFIPENRTPQNIRASLYLFNLPEKSLFSKAVVKNIDGIQAIQCLVLNIKSRPKESTINVYPLHKQIVDKIYKNFPIQDYFTISNGSDSRRSYKISKISQTKNCKVIIDQQYCQGTLQPKQQIKVHFSFNINQLSKDEQRGYFLIEFDNSPSKIFSVGGYVEYPKIKYSEIEIYFGLCRTYTKIKKQFSLTNEQSGPIQLKIFNPIKYYQLQFYDFYDFQEQENQMFKKKRFSIRNMKTKQSIQDNKQYYLNAGQTLNLELEYSTMSPQNVKQWFEVQILNGKTKRIPILATVKDIYLQISRTQINLRQIYKGNIYNSNKFLSKQLCIQNKSNIETTYQIEPPNQQTCIIKMQPMIFKIPPKGKRRIDLSIQPIKTGIFCEQIKWKYYDSFKVHPQEYPELQKYNQFNKEEGLKSLIKQQVFTLKAEIKGVQIKYMIKDQTRARRVRHKVDDVTNSVKYSTKSFKSSKASLHQQQKIVYPFLQQLNFYNCEINQVRQLEIIIQNQSDLTAQYNIEAQNYHTLEKVENKKINKGLVGQQQQAFSSDMGKTFLQNRVLDKGQKVHLSNNKGISIMCDPPNGILHKKQSQKIVITMFNDTSGRFRDNLLINVKNHEIKKFPIDIHIKGTPVLLSRNQLGINFNEQVPIMNIGSLLANNGIVKRSIKVINKGPKQVKLSWKTYPYNQIDKEKDIFKLQYLQGAPGTNDLVQIKWNAIQPELDKNSPFIIEPRQKTLKGRQEVTFNLIVNQLNDQLKTYQNLMICQPYIQDGQNKIKMENLAVVVTGQAVKPYLKMDLKHKNHINKLELFATEHILKQKQTNSNNNFRKLKLTNELKANLQFDINIFSKDTNYQSFKIVSINTNSPINQYDGNKTFVKDKKIILSYESFVQIMVQLTANKKDQKQWPLEPTTRKQGKIVLKFSNENQQIIDLIGWLYRPWVQLQMPNDNLYTIQNRIIDFGTIHVKNTKKLSIYLINPSKSDAKFTITYIKYQQSKKINFEQALWIAQDYQDLNTVDVKQCFFLNQDQGTVLNRSIPVHYMPGTLALPSEDDQYSLTHKPIKIDFLFKPKSNVLYKSKFRISFEDSIFYDVIVRGKGSFDEELLMK